MNTRTALLALILLPLLPMHAALAHGDDAPQPVDTSGLPPLGEELLAINPYRNDATLKDKAIEVGSRGYNSNCARCHGPEGRGNGTDSDHAADLTDNLRAELNTEGVLFYKIWNGHAIQLRTQVDDMPAFKDKLTRDEVWSIVEHVKGIRR